VTISFHNDMMLANIPSLEASANFIQKTVMTRSELALHLNIFSLTSREPRVLGLWMAPEGFNPDFVNSKERPQGLAVGPDYRLFLKPHESCEQITTNGITSSNVQITADKSNTMMGKNQKARLIVSSPETSGCAEPSPSVGTASITCMDDRTMDRLAKVNIKGAIARFIYIMVDQYGIL